MSKQPTWNSEHVSASLEEQGYSVEPISRDTQLAAQVEGYEYSHCFVVRKNDYEAMLCLHQYEDNEAGIRAGSAVASWPLDVSLYRRTVVNGRVLAEIVSQQQQSSYVDKLYEDVLSIVI
ncbi:MAG: hypothetical protein D6711_18370 [Chloroflexi bacterium]|nr:MAG: hypothetical protein D6711_18370 [Chloroflexota bacterium]